LDADANDNPAIGIDIDGDSLRAGVTFAVFCIDDAHSFEIENEEEDVEEVDEDGTEAAAAAAADDDDDNDDDDDDE
jgi:hypothetical protein